MYVLVFPWFQYDIWYQSSQHLFTIFPIFSPGAKVFRAVIFGLPQQLPGMSGLGRGLRRPGAVDLGHRAVGHRAPAAAVAAQHCLWSWEFLKPEKMAMAQAIRVANDPEN